MAQCIKFTSWLALYKNVNSLKRTASYNYAHSVCIACTCDRHYNSPNNHKSRIAMNCLTAPVFHQSHSSDAVVKVTL